MTNNYYYIIKNRVNKVVLVESNSIIDVLNIRIINSEISQTVFNG
jgi:hypothetical protein